MPDVEVTAAELEALYAGGFTDAPTLVEPGGLTVAMAGDVRTAAMVQRFRVTLEDGTTLVLTTDARDHRAYTRLRQGLNLPALTPSNPVDFIYLAAFVCWHAARYRTHETALDWPAWDAQVIDVAPMGPAAADPFTRAPTGA